MKKMNRNRLTACFLIIILFLTSCLGSYSPKVILKAQDKKSASFVGRNFEATFLLDSTYEGGYQARIQLKNTGKQTIHNWMLRVSFASELTNIWNASIVKHNADVYYVKNAVWNQDIKPNDTVEFGFTGTRMDAFAAPISYEIIESKNLVDDLDYQASSHLTNTWEDGFQGEIVITNNRENTLEDWSLEFDFNGEITQFFQAEIKSHTGNHYVIENAGYNGNLGTQETLTLGYIGTGGVVNNPTDYVLWDCTYEEVPATAIPVESENPTSTPTVEVQISTEPSLVTSFLPPESDEPMIEPSIQPSVKVSEEPKESTVPLPTSSVEESPKPSVVDIPCEYKESVLYPVLMLQGKADEEALIQEGDDYDRDGLTNLEEYQIGTDPGLADTDGDGLTDYEEYKNRGTDPVAYDSDGDGLGDGTEKINYFDPMNPDTDGDGILDGEEPVSNQRLTNEVYKELDRDELGVWPTITVRGKGDYSRQIRLEVDSYNGLYSDLDYLVSPVIHVQHKEDMEYESATVYFTIGEEILRSHRMSDLSIVRLEDGVTIPVKTEVDSYNHMISAEVDELCEYAVEDTSIREVNKEWQVPLEYLEIIYVIGLTGDKDTYKDYYASSALEDWDSFFSCTNYVYEYEIRSKFITYSDCTDDIQSYPWIRNPRYAVMDFNSKYKPVYETSLNRKKENKIRALNLARNSFTDPSYHKIIVLVSDEGCHEVHEKDYLVEQYKRELGENSDINFFDMKEYWHAVLYRTEQGQYYESYIYDGDMEFTLNESYYGELELAYLNHNLCTETDRYREDIENLNNILNEYLQLVLNEREEKLDRENARTILVRLPNYQFVRVSTDPTKDTDGDGIPDQSELAEITGYFRDRAGGLIPVYNYRSNPLKADTDGDGIFDGKDPQPLSFDVTVAGYGDNGVVRLNTGKAFQILFSEEYPVDRFMKEYYNRYVSLDKAELEGIYYSMQNAKRMDFNTEELICMNLLDEGLMKYLVQDKSFLYKCQFYEQLSGKVIYDIENGKPPVWNPGDVLPFASAKEVEHYFTLPIKQGAWLEYFDSTVKQILLGRFSGLESTPLGTIGEVGVAFTGVDVAQDIRDLLYDTSHWENSWEHVGTTALDAVCVLPIIGAVAKSDEIILFIKHTEKLYEIRRIARIGDSVVDAVKRATKATENLMSAAETMVKQFGDRAYRAMLYAQDVLRAQGRSRLKPAYANEFTEAFARYSDEIGTLSSKPSLLQRVFKNTMEDCTDSTGVVKSSKAEIQKTAKKYIDEALDEAPTTLSGEWMKVNEAMSDYSRRYQEFITGRDGEVWYQNGVKFDGMENGVLIDAKGKYDQFVDMKTGEFKEWFTGHKGILAEARRQVEASEGASIHWYFAQETSANTFRDLLGDDFPEIECIYRSMK